jgi:hypothetical protein
MSKSKKKQAAESGDLDESLFPTTAVPVGDKIYHVREITIGKRREILAAFNKDQDGTMYSVGLISGGCVEYLGKDTEILALPGRLFDKLSEAVANASGMNADDDEGGETKKAD